MTSRDGGSLTCPSCGVAVTTTTDCKQPETKHGEAAFALTVIEEVADLAGLVAAEQRQLNAALVAGPVYNLALDVSTPARSVSVCTDGQPRIV